MRAREVRRAAGGLALLVAVAAGEASAQAVCSAPHSSPTLAQSGSLGTLPAGAGWVQVSLFRQKSTDFFNPRGDRQPFLADAAFETRSVFVTAAVGLTEGVELWTQVPTHRLGVESAGGGSTSSGFGDVRVAARVSPELVGLEAPVAVRLGAKVPGSDFPVDATVLPLTEGQRDVEVSVESGAVLDLGVYVMGWVGHRWRGRNREADREPGDERFAHLALGGTLGPLSVELAADGLWGGAPLASGIRLVDEKRRLIQLLPTLGIEAGPGRLEATAQVPIQGRNLPVGLGLSVGYRALWGS